MSQDFQKVLVKDDRLMVTDSVKYAVIKGGSNMTCSQYQAISQSPASITFNVQVPSQETVISRNALIQTTLTFSVSATPNPQYLVGDPSAQLLDYGSQDAFGPFPFNQCVNSVQWTINNNTVSQNTREILPVLTRIHDKRWLARYNGMTPTMFDTYGNYNDADGANNNPLGNWQNSTSLDNDLIPRGCFPAAIQNAALTSGNQATAYITITVTEPVLVSPWTFAGDDSCGMYGIQNLNAIYNLTAGGVNQTAFRMANTDTRFLGAPVVTLANVTNTRLLLQYLTPHPSDLMPSRNCLPYYELPRYITSQTFGGILNATKNLWLQSTAGAVMSAGPILPPIYDYNTNGTITSTSTMGYAASSLGPAGTVTGGLPVPGAASIQSQSLQLNQIPDKLYITAALPPSFKTSSCADSYLAITSITINWNNSSGLLSSATQQDLWRMSTENGINQSWQEFRGFTSGPTLKVAQTYGATTVPVGTQTYIQTCGSVLCLEFGKDIELKDDYYAPGSLGNFQLQYTITVENYSPVSYGPGQITLQTIVQNSGVFSLERGVASSYLGILTKSDVLEASRDKPYAYSDAIRMVGGAHSSGFFKRLMGTLGRIAPKALPIVMEAIKDYRSHKDGGASGGSRSGGKKSMGSLEDRLY